jgi:hypothetical protein
VADKQLSTNYTFAHQSWNAGEQAAAGLKSISAESVSFGSGEIIE